MGGHNDPIALKEDVIPCWFLGEDINGSASHPAFLDSLKERLLIDYPTPGAINETDGWPDQRQLPGSD